MIQPIAEERAIAPSGERWRKLLNPEPRYHLPVLSEETLALLAPAPGRLYVDGTLGGGGHLCTLVYQPLQAGKTQPVGVIFGTIFFHPSPLSSAGLSTGRPPR